jgi:hypothetical protein
MLRCSGGVANGSVRCTVIRSPYDHQELRSDLARFPIPIALDLVETVPLNQRADVVP